MIASLRRADPLLNDTRILLSAVAWGDYVVINDALAEQAGVRMVYLDGVLSISASPSLGHEQARDHLDRIVLYLTVGLDIEMQPLGSTTFRSEALGLGVEGDRTYYLGANIPSMAEMREIDYPSEPPPDLVIEVETKYPSELTVAALARLGTPEIWRYDLDRDSLTFHVLDERRSYVLSDLSLNFPTLTASDVLGQLRYSRTLKYLSWVRQLEGWVRDEICPRLSPP